jgi:hypothetical protein
VVVPEGEKWLGGGRRGGRDLHGSAPGTGAAGSLLGPPL